MELRQLETFRVVMTTLNMTTAAGEVNLSPPAVSLQIKRLSEELGAELFIRKGPKVMPTLAAKRLDERLATLMNVLQAIHEDFPPEIDHDNRPFVLETGLTTLVYQLRKPIGELRQKFPRNDIQVRIGTTESIIENLQHKHVDLGLVSLPLQAPRIRLTPLFKEEMLVLMNRRKAAGYGKTLSLKELADIPMILYSSGANTREIIERMARRHELSLRVVMEMDNTEAIKKLVEAGFGASILPEGALRNSPSIRKFRIKGERLYREVAFATALSASPRKLTAAVFDFLSKRLLSHQTPGS